jgi:D-glycero-alpha-D-manno-heptose-7-phosphate kinase
MIASKTPFRLTLGGGGTDLPSFYRKHGGFVFATGLTKYMYITVNRPSVDNWVRLHHGETEKVRHASELHHELAREALLHLGVTESIEISALADIPAGTGLGSSSCYLVGLLKAIRALLHQPVSVPVLAEEACHIELNVLKKPIGKQDQYMAAYGGMTVMDIDKEGRVAVRNVQMKNCAATDFVSNVHLYYTGVKRDAVDILSEQSRKMETHEADSSVVEDSLLRIKDIGHRTLAAIEQGNLDDFGRLCDEHWQYKLKLSSKVSVPGMNEIYEETKKRFGVLGGKIAGAGGGGFLMLYCPNKHQELTRFMHEQRCKRIEYGIDEMGSRIITSD